MSVHLVGGGSSAEHAEAVWGGFLRAVAERAEDAGRRRARVAVVVLGTALRDRRRQLGYSRSLRRAGARDLGVRTRVTRVSPGSTCPGGAVEEVDGLLVGGGLTPDYHRALAPLYPRIRELVEAGLPYAGFSAGAVLAGTEAVVGGWRLDGVPVCPQECGEGLEELTVVPGMGLVAGAVEVHTAQWGTLSAMVAATQAGLVTGGVALDEDTTWELPAGRATGAGRVWHVRPTPTGVEVGRG